MASDDKFNDIRRHVAKKGVKAAMLDPKIRPILTAADKVDVLREGFLKALATMCVAAEQKGVPVPVMIECLKAAVDGLEHV